MPLEHATAPTPNGWSAGRRSEQTNETNWAAYVDTTAATELERLKLLEEVFDPYTARMLDETKVGPGWDCLEVGAGAGSVAGLLAERAGPEHVTATDLSTGFLAPLTEIGVRVLQHDVTTDAAPGEFDLIHSRLVLEHVAGRTQAIHRMVSWLKPGGRLLIESANPSPETPTVPAVGRCLTALSSVLEQTVGTAPRWARSLPLPLERAGLVDCSAEGHSIAVRGGSAMARWMSETLRLVESTALDTELVTENDLAEAYEAYRDPTFVDYTWMIIRASGRRPFAQPTADQEEGRRWARL